MGAVHVVDVKTGAEHFVCPGNSLEVLRKGQYTGHLLITQHRYFLAGGSFDWSGCLRPTDGKWALLPIRMIQMSKHASKTSGICKYIGRKEDLQQKADAFLQDINITRTDRPNKKAGAELYEALIRPREPPQWW